MVIDAVVFDVGETLIDETREYGTWADWLGIPRHTFSTVFGAVIALGMDYRDTFQYFRPGFNLDVERVTRAEALAQSGWMTVPMRACARDRSSATWRARDGRSAPISAAKP